MTRVDQSLREIADEQAALRRVAVRVAEAATPNDVFAAVAAEVAQLLDAPAISMVRFEPDETSTAIAVWGDENPFGVGATFEPWPGVMLEVRQTGRPARLEDFAYSTGPTTARLQAARIHSGVGVPITVDGRVWGTIIALATRGESLPDGIEERLSSFTELVATAIANAQARDELETFVREQEALRRVATVAATGGSSAEVFRAVVREVKELLDLPVVALTRYEPDRMVLMVAAAGDHPFTEGTRWSLDGLPVASLVLERRAPARSDEYVTDDPEVGEAIRAGRVRSGLAVPIMVDNEVWGTISTASTDQLLRPDTEKRLTAFTELVGSIVLRTQARDDLRALAEEQAALRRVATLVARETSTNDVLAAVAGEIAEILSTPIVVIARYEADGTAAVLGGHGTHPFRRGTVWRLDEPSAAREVLRTGRPARWSDYGSGRGETLIAARRTGLRSSLGVPITVDGKMWGVIVIATTLDDPIEEAAETRLVDFTELVGIAIANTQTRDDLRLLADEQAALRHVATLVARGAEPEAVFGAVCEVTGVLIGATSVNLCEFTADGFNVTLAGWSLRDTHVPTGTRLPLASDTINGLIRESGSAARVDSYERASGELAMLIRERGIRSEVGAPVIVNGHVWGALIAGTDGEEPLPASVETRLAGFTEAVATAVSNATTHTQLLASRARLVAAGDDARRRVERDLHDGTQQRLVALGLDVQSAQAAVPPENHQAHHYLGRIGRGLESVLEEVRELSRGLHPALLSQGGLQPALRALARKSPIRVALRVSIDSRPPESTEIATYYVVSEALANAAKHSNASSVAVAVTTSPTTLFAEIEDDGIGGAEVGAGSGLLGLVDRVEALGGKLVLDSPRGRGTRIAIELPFS